MQLKTTYKISNTLMKCKIGMCKFVPESNCTTVSGISETGYIAVYHKVPATNIVDKQIGMFDVKRFVNKLKLMNLDNAECDWIVDEREGKEFTKQIVLKEGRKKISMMFPIPWKLQLPISGPSAPATTLVRTKEEDATNLKQAITTMAPSEVKISTANGDVSISFSDSEGDKYSMVIGDSDYSLDFNYDKAHFMTLFNNLIQYSKTGVEDSSDISVSFGISDNGIISMNIDEIVVMLAPIMQ